MLLLIRHATPAVAPYSGFPGPALGDHGRRQALAIARVIATAGVQQIYASDYLRAIETAAHLSSDVVTVTPVSAIRGREKDLESLSSHVRRVHSWLRETLSVLTAQPVAIVSHCGTLNILQFFMEIGVHFDPDAFIDEKHRHTPLGGVWGVTFSGDRLEKRKLLFDGRL